MRPSILSVLFAVALSSEGCTAIPESKTEMDVLDQDMLLSEVAENAFAPNLPFAGKSGSTKIIVVGDEGLWRSARGLDRLPLFHKQSVLGERRDVEPQEPSISIIRRDTRCMVGRVYRPCWES